MSTLFTKIINGEISCYKVAETDKFLAFLDVNPNAKGHTLCIPKVEVDKIFDLDDATFLELMLFSKKVASILEKAVSCKRIGMAVIGLEVPHAHLHLVPLQETDDLNFTRGKMTLSGEALKICQEKILAFL